jgi:hypothetical protein
MSEVQKFRKKPVVIEAVQFVDSKEGVADVLRFCKDAQMNQFERLTGLTIMIKTLEGQHIASVGDWIIKGVQGEFYPCKPDIFEQTYEPATPDVSPVPPTAEKGENEMLTVSAVCMCAKCESSGRYGRYRMVGHCTNCGQTDILMLFRSGDEAHNRDCPTCGSRGHGTFGGVHPDRLATPDEIPAAEPNPT